jgi:hypothetical protein
MFHRSIRQLRQRKRLSLPSSSLSEPQKLGQGRPQQPVLRCSGRARDASDLWCSYQQHVAFIDFNHNVVPCNVTGDCPLQACGR